MTNERRSEKHLALGKKQVFKEGRQFRTEILKDRTIFNLEALGRDCKLRQAYRSVRNLEYRYEGTLKLQTFKEYAEVRGKLLKLRFSAEQRPRPEFPLDEAYRNNKTNIHYPKGDLLVLVDSAVYDTISDSINQYVLDVGRDGYWATIHILSGGTPVDVRSYINGFNPVGVLLVGAIAVPWFELEDDFHGVHSEFPCDLYYMASQETLILRFG